MAAFCVIVGLDATRADDRRTVLDVNLEGFGRIRVDETLLWPFSSARLLWWSRTGGDSWLQFYFGHESPRLSGLQLKLAEGRVFFDSGGDCIAILDSHDATLIRLEEWGPTVEGPLSMLHGSDPNAPSRKVSSMSPDWDAALLGW